MVCSDLLSSGCSSRGAKDGSRTLHSTWRSPRTPASTLPQPPPSPARTPDPPSTSHRHHVARCCVMMAWRACNLWWRARDVCVSILTSRCVHVVPTLTWDLSRGDAAWLTGRCKIRELETLVTFGDVCVVLRSFSSCLNYLPLLNFAQPSLPAME